MAEDNRLIVKVQKIESIIHGDRIRIMDIKKKNKLDFPYSDVNYNQFNALLKGRLLAYFYAYVEGNTLKLSFEAPFQGW